MSPSRVRNGHRTAFTLIEVMVAMGIFVMAMFAILEVVSTNLRNAKQLQKPRVDASLLISDLYQTNKLYEGNDSGDFDKLYPGYQWESTTTKVGTNGLFQVDFVIIRPDHFRESAMSVILWRPDSPTSGVGLR
jgi:prepilin-type N-terminal cleavage/methylation domain-containing protein